MNILNIINIVQNLHKQLKLWYFFLLSLFIYVYIFYILFIFFKIYVFFSHSIFINSILQLRDVRLFLLQIYRNSFMRFLSLSFFFSL